MCKGPVVSGHKELKESCGVLGQKKHTTQQEARETIKTTNTNQGFALWSVLYCTYSHYNPYLIGINSKILFSKY